MTTIPELVRRRGIREIVHFTTNKGLTGMLASGVVKSRTGLHEDAYIEHIMTENCPTRRDHDWLDYVNLSITDINAHLFNIASGKWHAGTELWWCILAFDPEIMSHEGVYFATTNNMYTGVKRERGPAGLEALFADPVVQYTDVYGRAVKSVFRTDEHRACDPTCEQAEVLYPGELALKYLTRVYVATEAHQELTAGILGTFDREDVTEHAPHRFGGRSGRHHG